MSDEQALIGGRFGRVVAVEELTPDDVLEMLRDEFRIAANEGLGHFEEGDVSRPGNGEMVLTAYGRRWRLRCVEEEKK